MAAPRNVTLETSAAQEELVHQRSLCQVASNELIELEEKLQDKNFRLAMLDMEVNRVKERARWRLQRAETELSKLKDSPEPLSAADLTQYQDAVMVYQDRIATQTLRKRTLWRIRTTKVFLSELKKKEKRVEESYISYEHWGMVKEDVKTTTSHMIQTEVDKNKEKEKLTKEISDLEAGVSVAQLRVSAMEDRRTELDSKVQTLKTEIESHETAATAQILRRATLPEGPRPRRIVQLAQQIKMDWCCITTGSDGKTTSMTIAEFKETPECGVVQQLAETYGARSTKEFLFWFPSNDVQEGRYVHLRAQLWPQLKSPLYQNPPTKLNFFELLRTSLGDSQFNDVWLVPEAPHFHQKALGLDKMIDFEPPKAVAKHLRPYQLAGFRWLACLCKNGLGAVLADDMGLGKTLQCISVLVYMKEHRLLTNEQNQKCPALVVVPPGLLRNWQREFERWAPHLTFYVYHGPKRSLPENKGTGFDVLLTTYEMIRNDRAKFADAHTICFSGMVIDEAQKIKNHGALVSRAVKEVGNAIGHTRIALSGTPIENKVDELHSIFDFVNYGYLGDQDNFARTFSKIIEKGKDPAKKAESLELLKRLTAPFQMRRLKTDQNILPDLPEKIDLASTINLTKEQEKLYLAIQEDFKVTMTRSRETKDNHAFERRGHIFAMLERVRRVCSHPLCLARGQFPESCKKMPVSERIESSGKTTRLVELLEELLPAKQKAVVFATRKDVISVLKKLLQAKFTSTEVLIFTGDLSLQERNDVEQRFQNDPRYQILLITVQCGGIGLNLTAANHVIHFDRCYNPAKEAQATDRCHRLGQKRAVCVHRLITEGTYEEQLEKIMARKQDLSSLTVSRAEDWIADYTDEALFDLFMLRTGSGASRRPAVPLVTPPRTVGAHGPPITPSKRAAPSNPTMLGASPKKRAK